VVSNSVIGIKKIPINKSIDKLDAIYDIDELDAIYAGEASVHSDKSKFYDPEGATERGVSPRRELARQKSVQPQNIQ
jgi:hypothetical protein